MGDGLRDHERSLIQAALSRIPGVHRAILYGSRALGTFRPGSDLDLALEGPGLQDQDLVRLAGYLDELPLPYRYDLTDYHAILNQALRDHIDRYGVVFWTRLPPSESLSHG
jgi:predicted nucleotidyltransferase